jgi:hypothetical protein
VQTVVDPSRSLTPSNWVRFQRSKGSFHICQAQAKTHVHDTSAVLAKIGNGPIPIVNSSGGIFLIDDCRYLPDRVGKPPDHDLGSGVPSSGDRGNARAVREESEPLKVQLEGGALAPAQSARE